MHNDRRAPPKGFDFVTTETNSWRIAKASRASLIVDADDYFRAGRLAMLSARHRIMLIGWDFDARIDLGRENESEGPLGLGDFVLWLVKRRPDLEIYLLRWDLGAIRTLFRGTTIFTLMRWMWHARIHTRLDGAHPTGSSHHQKIVVIDDCFAFCGGIDMTSNRWDTREHRDHDTRRRSPGGAPYAPWHDATTALQGPVAAALGELARARWEGAGGRRLPPVSVASECWPASLVSDFENVRIAVSRSMPAYRQRQPILEIESVFLALIARARRFIYAESQYFASRRLAEAFARRLEESDGPEVVLVNPVSSIGWLEPIAMDTARARLFVALRRLDRQQRLRLYHPVTAGGEAIYVHAKLMIVDDEVLHVGSSNMNNRSMRLDTECDVTIDAALEGNKQATTGIARIRVSLLAEHLGVAPERIADVFSQSGSLIETIESLRSDGRCLQPYQVPNLHEVEKWLADNEVLDPNGPAEMFESLTQGKLLGGLRRHLVGLRRRPAPPDLTRDGTETR
jgi:phosphatidylserine/phosphatidylglycerophosphate/cardiolipin synthase-like enzyme